MPTEITSTKINAMYDDLKVVKEAVYDKCGLELTDLKQHSESLDYCACSFSLNGKAIQYRASKITPAKTGQFVTLWKRNAAGITAPFDFSDNLDFILITSKEGDNVGQFIFPKAVLADKGIITRNGKAGKRGIRVYPPWAIVINKQAEKTQRWQTNFFLTIKKDNATDLGLIKALFTDNN